MKRSIDLNADLGESYGPWSKGEDAAMLSLVTSANIACGGHAGDHQTMFETLKLAAENDVVVGAHPGYEDRQGFGRRIIPMRLDEISTMVSAQIGALMGVSALAGINVDYVKAHGALANLAARDKDVAKAIVDAVRKIDESLAILAISGTEVEEYARSAGVSVYSEIFADRGYLSSGQLVPRDHPEAMISDPDAASDRLIGFLESGFMPVIDGDPIALNADSICVHGDNPTAVAIAKKLKSRLVDAGFDVKSFMNAHG